MPDLIVRDGLAFAKVLVFEAQREGKRRILPQFTIGVFEPERMAAAPEIRFHCFTKSARVLRVGERVRQDRMKFQ